MQDKILVSLSLLALYLFCGVVVVYVGEVDLMVTMILVLLLTTHDFWISVFRSPAPAGMRDDIEERPNPVSGKPLAGPKDDYTPR